MCSVLCIVMHISYAGLNSQAFVRIRMLFAPMKALPPHGLGARMIMYSEP